MSKSVQQQVSPAGVTVSSVLSWCVWCSLTNLDGLNEVVEEIFDHPDKIAWLDFSCNQLKMIEPILLTHTNLRSLYLQGNQITDVKEVFMPTNLACLIL